MQRIRLASWLTAGLAALVVIAAAPSGVTAQQRDKITIVIFGAPSLGAFLPPVIKAEKLDEKNGLAIKFEERTPDAYTAQFNSGEFQLGDQVFHAKKGACVNIPPGVPHKVGSKEGMRMLMVYSPPGLEGMMKAMKASKIDILFNVGLPRTMPYFFASLKVAVTQAFVGTVIADCSNFGGSTRISNSGSCPPCTITVETPFTRFSRGFKS